MYFVRTIAGVLNIKKISEVRMLEIFCPNVYYETIYDIDLEELKRMGIKGLIFDFDNTLVARGSKNAPNHLQEWLKELDKNDFKICVVSNNWESKIGAVTKKLNMPLVAQAGKPRGKAFKYGMDVLGTSVEETAVIGDQLFTDVLGGNRLGLVTVLVVPVGKSEMVHTKLLRHLERLIIRRLRKRRMMVSN